MSNKKHSNGLRRLPLAIVAIVVYSLFFSSVTAITPKKDNTPITPQIPTANRYQKGKIFLEHADQLLARDGENFQILTGNVEFRRGDMFMYCDSAHFFDATSSIEAYGNVRMEQGDTLFVYADELVYTDSTQLAILYSNPGKVVRLINKDVELTTTIFNYDLGIDLGYYEVGGELNDKQNNLVSRYGEYSPSTSEAVFTDDVVLTSLRDADTLRIFTDNLYYNTQTHIAELDQRSIITNKDGRIYTDSAIYNTETSDASLYRRSFVITSNNNTLTGDSLYYNRKTGIGEAYGNMILTDSANSMILTGDYGFYNELTDSALATGRALAREFSQGDTLYLHSDTIRSYREVYTIPAVDSLSFETTDTTHYVIAAHRVKFFRSDLQGICDSLTFEQKDSMLYMDRHPIVWSDNRQIFGNVIQVHLNDSTVDYALLPEFGFMAEEIEPGFYQQLTGKEMLATFYDGHLKNLDVSGNVLAISYPEENDSTYNKVVSLESSYLSADFVNNNVEKMKCWPESSSTITPLYLAKKSQLFLQQFKWYPNLRPTSPEDVFNISEEFIKLMAEPDPAPKRRGADSKKQDAKPARGEAKPADTPGVQTNLQTEIQDVTPAEVPDETPDAEQNEMPAEVQNQ